MKFLNEADIQGYLFHLCLCAGIDAHLEYAVLLPCGKRLIADLVVFHGEKPACLVEVKKSKRRGTNTSTRQYKKYTLTKIPFIYCRNESQIDSTINQIKIFMEK